MRRGSTTLTVLWGWLCLVGALVVPWAYVFSQAAPTVDPISGGAGWVGAGLLGLVLAWLLLKHLPDKDRQTALLIAAKDSAVNDVVKVFREEVREQRHDNQMTIDKVNSSHEIVLNQICAEFKEDAAAERLICEKNFEALAKSIGEEVRRKKP